MTSPVDPPQIVVTGVGDYVAELQLHMALQVRRLVPTITKATDSRERMLQETQAHWEKQASRYTSSM